MAWTRHCTALSDFVKVPLTPKPIFGSSNIPFVFEKKKFSIRKFKSFDFYGELNLYFGGPVSSVLLPTRSLRIACFMTSGKVVGSDIAVSRYSMFTIFLCVFTNPSLVIYKFFTGEFTNYSLVSS